MPPDPLNILWDDGQNWKLSEFPNGPHTTGAVPEEFIATYVTSSDMLSPDVDPTLINGGTIATTGAFYVGGWSPAHDVEHGDPRNPANPALTRHRGVLDITGGELNISAKETPGQSPPCHYLRLGYRGADGTINQSNGSVIGCTPFTFGYDSPDSLGIWNLSGGLIETNGIDVGVMGTGIVLMDGGTIQPPAGVDSLTTIGQGYSTPAESYEPGVGFVNQRGGAVQNYNIEIGTSPGAIGTYAVRDDASLIATGSLRIGANDGFGALVQTGGTVSAPLIGIGGSKGAIGSFTISGGTLDQTSMAIGSHWLFNGESGDNGTGRLMVVGVDPVVNAKRYYQNANSRLVFMLVSEAPHINPIVVEDRGLFEFGGTLMIELQPDPISSGNAFTPMAGQTFVLMTANPLDATGRLTLDSDIVADWKIETTSTTLSVHYCPGAYALPPCD